MLGWTLAGSTATRTIAGPLAPRTSTTAQISLTCNVTAGGVRDWINYSEIGSADNDQNPIHTACRCR
ncbi:MAG: hypothetical protein IPN86_07945 [Saprospiraceae bacterium]|nr:hypothetical protein [Saprospiraceae bacterium]